MKRNTAPWIAFLAMAFAVVGLVGVFATYAGPLPYERMMSHDVALDEALAAGDSKAALEPLRERLGDDADRVIEGKDPLAARVAMARGANHAEMVHEADAIAFRLRLELVVVTIVAAVFGAVTLVAVTRAA